MFAADLVADLLAHDRQEAQETGVTSVIYVAPSCCPFAGRLADVVQGNRRREASLAKGPEFDYYGQANAGRR